MYVLAPEIPSPELSSLLDFPRTFLNQGVCGSNFPILQLLPSLGCSSGAHSSLDNGCFFCPACLELERLGPVHHPYSVHRKSRGPAGPQCQGPGERALETQKAEISITPSRLQTAPAPQGLGANAPTTSGPISMY